MVDDTLEKIDRTRRRITANYHTSLLIVAALILSIAFSSLFLINEQRRFAEGMMLASKQHVLTLRSAFLAQQVSHLPVSDRQEKLQELHATYLALQKNNNLLRRNGLVATLSRHVNGANVTVNQFDKNSTAFIKTISGILYLMPKQITPTHPLIVSIKQQAEGPMLEALSQLTEQHEPVAIRQFASHKWVIFALSGAAIFMLTLVALFILRPAIAYVAQAQKRTLELNRLKSDFLANMSHEIRTPMNGIFGMTELLSESELNTRQQYYILTLQKSADHLLGLINDILDFSKLEAGEMKLEPLRFNLHSTIEDVMDLIGNRAREKNLELLLRYRPGTPKFIVADPGRIRQMLFNLIGNALKFTDEGYVLVHVETKTKSSSPKLIIRIEDTGIGIPENAMNSLFVEFMQVESGSTRARQGTGLGLSISQNLARLMGGKIAVSSTPGQGSVFSIELPLVLSKEDGDVTEEKESVQPSFNGKRMLLVDDLAPNRMLYKELLEDAGIETLVAENAEEAFSILGYEYDNNRRIDAMVVDYMMPVVNGIDLTRRLKSHDDYANVPVIILSSAGEYGLIRQFADAGAQAALTKPASRSQFFDTLEHVLSAAERGERHSLITSEVSKAINARRLLAHERPLYGIDILLVEDNRVNSEIITEMLEQMGCSVTAAENGQKGLELVQKRFFDLIFMDCQMPVMDGFEAAQRITQLKASGSIANVPVVALTANAMEGDRERCLESGMDDYLSKPLRKANLEAVLLKWLRDKLEKNHAATPKTEAAPSHSTSELTLVKTSTTPETEIDFMSINKEIFERARTIMGSKLETIVGYYLEDSELYINRIAQAIRDNDHKTAMEAAHTLKSSSYQLGAETLSALAAHTEKAAKEHDTETLQDCIDPLVAEFSRVRPCLQSACS